MNRWIACLLSLVAWAHGADWRVELLAEGGIGTSRAELRRALDERGPHPEQLADAYAQLGSPRYPERLQAQQSIIAAGPAALDWIDQQAPATEPEVWLRLHEIRHTLTQASADQRRLMQLHAARSLLAELEDPHHPGKGDRFYEWFPTPVDPLPARYRQWQLDSAAGMPSRVRNQTLIHDGQRPGEGDQRLVLPSTAWPGTPTFPAHFSLRATIRGTADHSGSWHLGISVGQVRALYHPGYRGGAFRFEQIRTGKKITRNQAMGFTPATDRPQQVQIDVARHADETVELQVTISQEGDAPYRRQHQFTTDQIGQIRQLGLDRSGRTGGSALFHDVVVELLTP